MDESDESIRHPGLTFAQAEVNYILGHSLRSIYQELLQQPVPSHLLALLDQMETKSSPEPRE
jgi:hypothetical protein